ncbi:17728_t:CDS:2, partial [Rhizophagus irregularis]
MLFLWGKEENPFDSSKLERWYEMIDLTFHNTIIDLVRSDDMTCASSDRKNIYKDHLEFGTIEAGFKWEGHNGTKYLNDSLKLNKMMK